MATSSYPRGFPSVAKAASFINRIYFPPFLYKLGKFTRGSSWVWQSGVLCRGPYANIKLLLKKAAYVAFALESR